jgi:putative lipoprotein
VLLALALASASPAHADTWWGPDKALHLSISTGLALGTAATAHLLQQGPAGEVALATTVTLVAGMTKELFDLAGLGSPSWKDFAWDAIGCAIGALTWVLLHQLLGDAW